MFPRSPVPIPAPKPGPTLPLWLRTPSPGAMDSCPSGRGQEMVFRPLIPANSREPGTSRPCQLGPQGSWEGGLGRGAPHGPSSGCEPQLPGHPRSCSLLSCQLGGGQAPHLGAWVCPTFIGAGTLQNQPHPSPTPPWGPEVNSPSLALLLRLTTPDPPRDPWRAWCWTTRYQEGPQASWASPLTSEAPLWLQPSRGSEPAIPPRQSSIHSVRGSASPCSSTTGHPLAWGRPPSEPGRQSLKLPGGRGGRGSPLSSWREDPGGCGALLCHASGKGLREAPPEDGHSGLAGFSGR